MDIRIEYQKSFVFLLPLPPPPPAATFIGTFCALIRIWQVTGEINPWHAQKYSLVFISNARFCRPVRTTTAEMLQMPVNSGPALTATVITVHDTVIATYN